MSEYGRYAVPDPPLGAGRAERRRYEADHDLSCQLVGNIWFEFCEGMRVVENSGGRWVMLAWEPPRLGPITLGPPTRFSVELRPGQCLEDFVAVRRRLAIAYGCDDVDITPLSSGWITVHLVEVVDDPAPAPEALPPAATRPLPPPPVSSTGGVRVHRWTRSWRGFRRPWGGPRSWKRA